MWRVVLIGRRVLSRQSGLAHKMYLSRAVTFGSVVKMLALFLSCQWSFHEDTEDTTDQWFLVSSRLANCI